MAGEASPTELSSELLEDVEDFVETNEGESSLSSERIRHVSDLMKIGNQAFRENCFEEAINCYSRANSVKPGDPVILSNRCAAYLRICQFLRHRRPSVSEYSPLSGLDPTIHAELALKDAEKVMNFQGDSTKSYILKASALIMLEKYELARDVILSGLHVDPTSDPLKDLERTTASTIGSRGHGKPERTDDFDCTVCLKLLYEPVTTPCGHTFCRSCLFQSMDRGNRCPLCRTVLFISPRTCAISFTLNNIIKKTFPEEYDERKLENESLTSPGGDFMPLFVMDVVLPCQKLHLNIFEPRYRLMVRRVMEGNRRMGMVIPDSRTGSIADFACEVEITECEPLPDGRFFLELESRRRFRVLRDWDQDGYRVAEIEWVRDISPSAGTTQREDLQEVINAAAEYAQSWMKTAREEAQQRQDRARLLELDELESMMPTTRDPELYSFWLTTLTRRRPSEKLELLRERDTNQRISKALVYLRLEAQTCAIQ
ncbi:uncharacterized protein LOC131311459 isoform X1 [Rhododendron vialii]|uniref:uncharacterized protein LOC131311459 isoform X1 n=1 Tax=Rhododendron vialii TaxID=182163 RepID=UPI00265EEAE5|nr:uncharacterized protein LOC131311459 isoform X1 [Rhododendron vialii]XP_058194922.1 uncharacterized protein LOC131311459 isoform X1 [Rhododendron vialii]XP_058194923.1 uncharacterized protein LOC131311459 isoform X1 [Rhododendron vialii]